MCPLDGYSSYRTPLSVTVGCLAERVAICWSRTESVAT